LATSCNCFCRFVKPASDGLDQAGGCCSGFTFTSWCGSRRTNCVFFCSGGLTFIQRCGCRRTNWELRLKLGFDIAFIVVFRLGCGCTFCGLAQTPGFACCPTDNLGLGDVCVDEVALFIAGAVVGRIALGGNPPNVRIDVGGERISAPLPADAEEHGRGRSPLGKREDNSHGITYDEETTREIRAGPTNVLEGENGCASFEYALWFSGCPRLG